MSLDITFTLSDDDLDHFQKIVDKAKSAMESTQSSDQIEAAARKLIDDSRSAELPDFIAVRLAKLEVVINMVGDAEWKLSEEEREKFRNYSPEWVSFLLSREFVIRDFGTNSRLLILAPRSLSKGSRRGRRGSFAYQGVQEIINVASYLQDSGSTGKEEEICHYRGW